MAAYFDFLSKILFDTFVFLVFLMAIYNVKFSQIAKRLPPLLLLTLPVSLIATVTDSMLIFTLITYIYCFVFYSLVFRYPPMKIITGYAITLIIMTILNLIQMVVIMQFTDNPFTNTSTYITEAMAFIIAILLYKFGHMDKLYDALIVKNQVSRNIILAVFALMVSMVLYQRISPKDFMNIFMTFLFIVILILILYSGMYKNYMSLRESRKQLQSYEQYLPIIEDLIDQVRMRQHDYNNELQAISMLPAPPALPAGLPSDLLERRPDIRAAEFLIMANNANIGVARAQFFPSISLTGMLGTVSSSVGSLFSGPAGVWSYGVSGNVPLLDFGNNWYNLKDAEAKKRAAIAEYRKAVQNAFADIRTSLTAQREADAIVRSMQIQVESLRRSTQIARLQYDNGYTDYLTVLDAERQLFAAELQLAGALRDRLDSVVGVCMALGGGWQDSGARPGLLTTDAQELARRQQAHQTATPAATPAATPTAPARAE